jgi:hypothetical protein
MNSNGKKAEHFFIKNCSLAAIATGESAGSLLELRDKLMTVDEGSIYYHFWGDRMNPQFVPSQQHNEFARWISHNLHDQILAEKLSIIDPTEFDNLEALRQEILETIDRRLDDYEIILWTKKENRFHFIHSTIIVFDSSVSILKPEDLAPTISRLPPSSIFYHFIDARARTPEKMDDFSLWLKIFGSEYDELIESIQSIDPYFLSLRELRDELTNKISQYFEKRGSTNV